MQEFSTTITVDKYEVDLTYYYDTVREKIIHEGFPCVRESYIYAGHDLDYLYDPTSISSEVTVTQVIREKLVDSILSQFYNKVIEHVESRDRIRGASA